MKNNIKVILSVILVIFCINMHATIVDGKEYYIISDYYEKALGASEDGSAPRLSAYGKNADGYVFVAEKSDTEGYYFLKQKSTGKYLAASSSSAWTVLFQDTKKVDDTYLWRFDVMFGGNIVNKKSSSKCLGCDWTKEDYVSVYYDKSASSLSRFSVIPVSEGRIEASLKVAETEKYVNKYGNNQRDIYSLSTDMELSGEIDLHLVSKTKPIDGGSINITSDKAWVIFDEIRPSNVISTYLKYIKVNGVRAANGQNVRVAIYLDGAAVIPYASSLKPMQGYTQENFEGDEYTFGVGNSSNLGGKSNMIRSLKLRRGFMATLASGENGGGYSRVYVADHHDIEIPVLPEALNRRISSIHIKKWQYASKKGWCSTTSNNAINTECNKMEASWFYTWSADRNTTQDREYIPIWQHLYWPSISQISGKTESTAVLGFNEPEHAEQHTSSQCSCGGTIDPWKACTKTPDLQQTGMRIGSPAPTDEGWLYNYVGHCDDMSYRCDFVAVHCYWGTNEANGAQAWYNRLKAIYDKTKRPIWITEWGYGASWTTESWPSGYSEKLEKNRAGILEIVNMLESCPFVERYSFYNWDTYYRACINTDDGWVTPAGEVYRDTKSTFAYNADVQFTPIWWKPSAKAPEMKTDIDGDNGKLVITIKNGNGDLTDVLKVQRKSGDGEWQDFYVDTDRSKFDKTDLTYTFDLTDIDRENDSFRVVVTTIFGVTKESTSMTTQYIVNPNIETGTKDEVEGWTCKRSGENGFTKATGDTYFELWTANVAGAYFDYSQQIEGLPEGVYELSAVCFNSTNGVEGATVNGNVGLYAATDGIEYFSPVTTDGEIDYERKQTIEKIIVRNGKLLVGIKNIGPMSARWAGADNFDLKFIGSIEEIMHDEADEHIKSVEEEMQNRYQNLFLKVDENTSDASSLIINPRCEKSNTYGWTTENIEIKTGEAYDGVSTNAYWDKWKSSNLSSSMSQTIENLPAGEYTASALLRGSASVNIELKAVVTSKEGEKTYLRNFTGTGATSVEGSEYKNGWQKVETESFDIAWGDKVVLTATAKGGSSSGWWSADNFSLYWKENIIDAIESTKATNNGMTIVPTGNGMVQIYVKSETQTSIFSTSGTLIDKLSLEEGTNTIILPKGMYVIGRKKVAVF